jgi:hypothetical protein
LGDPQMAFRRPSLPELVASPKGCYQLIMGGNKMGDGQCVWSIEAEGRNLDWLNKLTEYFVAGYMAHQLIPCRVILV